MSGSKMGSIPCLRLKIHERIVQFFIQKMEVSSHFSCLFLKFKTSTDTNLKCVNGEKFEY